jgi:hypothetical protein
MAFFRETKERGAENEKKSICGYAADCRIGADNVRM